LVKREIIVPPESAPGFGIGNTETLLTMPHLIRNTFCTGKTAIYLMTRPLKTPRQEGGTQTIFC